MCFQLVNCKSLILKAIKISKKIASVDRVRYNGSMRFERSKFSYIKGLQSNYLNYDLNGNQVCVARFRYRKAPVTKAKFMNVLIKHYTVEDYFEKLRSAAPLKILMNDGLLVPTSDGKIVLEGKVIFGN